MDIKKYLYEKFMAQLAKQAEEGAPLEAMGFVSHNPDAPGMPSIEHEHGRKRPDFVEKDLEGWEPV